MTELILNLKTAIINTNDILLFTGILFFLAFTFFAGQLIGRLYEKAQLQKQIKEGRLDAVKRSRAVLGGQMYEQIAPFLPGFPCNPQDVRFIGKPIDFIAFPGAAEGKSIEEVLFIEVKTGESKLSTREKEIRDAIQSKKVRYIEYRAD